MLDEARSDDIVILTLNQPARRNALSKAMRDQLSAAFKRLEEDRTVRTIILTGAGGTFCSGGDISEMQVADTADAGERIDGIHHMVRTIAGSSKLVIAAIEGWAAGAGLSLALLCDTLVATSTAKFVASFGKIGLAGDLGILQTLPARIGAAQARQMLFYAEAVDSEQAARIGLVDHLALEGSAIDTALRRAALVRSIGPLPLAATKTILSGGLEATLSREREAQMALYVSGDHAEGKRAFLEKRPAIFRAR